MTNRQMPTSPPLVGGPDRSPSVRWTTWTRRHPRPAMAGWALLLVASLAIGSWSEVRLASAHAIDSGTDRAAAATAATLIRATTGTVVIGGRGRLPASTVAAVRSDLAILMSRIPGVDTVGTPVVSAGGTSAVVTVTLAGADVEALRQVVRRVAARHPGVDVSITGWITPDAVSIAA